MSTVLDANTALNAARDKAVEFLARREHSRYELKQKLQARGFDETALDTLLDELVSRGWQSDQRFTAQYIQSRQNKGFGIMRITADLRQRGIDSDLAQNCLSQAAIDWADIIANVRLKRFGRDIPKDWNEKAKQMRFLQQRGFTQEQIQAVLQTD